MIHRRMEGFFFPIIFGRTHSFPQLSHSFPLGDDADDLPYSVHGPLLSLCGFGHCTEPLSVCRFSISQTNFHVLRGAGWELADLLGKRTIK